MSSLVTFLRGTIILLAMGFIHKRRIGSTTLLNTRTQDKAARRRKGRMVGHAKHGKKFSKTSLHNAGDHLSERARS